MAKSVLHNEKTREIILEEIRRLGMEEATACSVDGGKVEWAAFDGVCSSSAYYNYKSKNPEFVEAVEAAKLYYRQSLIRQDSKKRQALVDAIARECKDGYVTRKKRTRKDDTGKVIETVEETTVTPPREFLFRVLLWGEPK